MDEGISLSPQLKVYTGVILTCAFVAGILANGISIISVCFYTKTTTRVLYSAIINLFIVGLLLDVAYYPLLEIHIINNWPRWKFGEALCDSMSIVENVCTSVYNLTLLLLAVDGYLVTIHKKSLSVKTLLISSLLIWVLCGSIHGPFTFPENPTTVHNITICNSLTGKPLLFRMRYMEIADIVNMTFLLIASILVVYTGIRLWRKKITDRMIEKKYLRQQCKITCIIIGLCWFFWLPKWLVNISRGQGMSASNKMIILANTVGAINSVIPFIVLLMFLKDFRRTLINIYRRKAERKCLLRMRPNKPGRHKDSLKEPLAEKSDKQSHIELPVFEKGRFTTSNNNLQDLQRVSIDSSALEEHLINEKGACSNQTFDRWESKF